MARVGPNQDINDPETLINLAFHYQQTSDDKGDFLAQSNAQDPNVSGPPIVDVSIPFRIQDGSTVLLRGSDISRDDGEYIYDTDLVASAGIVTYVDLAERFREYWNLLNNVSGQLVDYEFSEDEDIEPHSFTTTIFDTTWEIGSQGGTSYNLGRYTHSPTEPSEEPEWDGVGPADYNQLTYPQLLTELTRVGTHVNETILSWEEDYTYSKSTSHGGASVGFTQHENFRHERFREQQYVQFYNPGETDITISMSMTISSVFDTRFSANVTSWAEIQMRNVYPNPIAGFKSLLDSYQQTRIEHFRSDGPINISVNRTVVIPPNKSAFVGCRCGSGTGFTSEDLIASISASVTLEGHTTAISWSFP